MSVQYTDNRAGHRVDNGKRIVQDVRHPDLALGVHSVPKGLGGRHRLEGVRGDRPARDELGEVAGRTEGLLVPVAGVRDRIGYGRRVAPAAERPLLIVDDILDSGRALPYVAAVEPDA